VNFANAVRGGEFDWITRAVVAYRDGRRKTQLGFSGKPEMKTKVMALGLLLFPFFSAADVLYDESIDGDLPGINPGGITTYTEIDFGQSGGTVVGTTPWRFNSPDPSDGFQFNVGENEIFRITFEESIVGNTTDDPIAWIWLLDAIDPPSVSGITIAEHFTLSTPMHPGLPNGPENPIETVLIEPGDYILYDNFRFPDPNNPPTFDPDLVRLDYAITVQVSRVPIPPPLITFFCASATIFVNAKRKHKKGRSA
tara:strand:- start:527 stop:1285 length:759 start_codon:yes stop_codon:yes gene_type:complete